MYTKLAPLYISLFLFVTPFVADALSCAPPKSDKDFIQSGGIIFEGAVKSNDIVGTYGNNEQRAVNFRVTKVWGGKNIPQTFTVVDLVPKCQQRSTFFNFFSSLSIMPTLECSNDIWGIRDTFEIGKRYIVYAKYDSKLEQYVASIGACAQSQISTNSKIAKLNASVGQWRSPSTVALSECLGSDHIPVCGLKNGVPQTYTNMCYLQADGAAYKHKGECLTAEEPAKDIDKVIDLLEEMGFSKQVRIAVARLLLEDNPDTPEITLPADALIEVVNPKGGEYYIGNTLNIKWNFGTWPAEDVIINLYESGGGLIGTVSRTKVRKGQFLWKIPGKLDRGYIKDGKYKLALGVPYTNKVFWSSEFEIKSKRNTKTSSCGLTRNLYYGASGEDVADLQKFLKKKGFYNYRVTGYYGRVTQGAVQSYKKTMLQLSDGFEEGVGPITRKYINKQMCADYVWY